MFESLAKKRMVRFEDYCFKTPLLVPSFSSKIPEKLANLLEVSKEFLEAAALISAYDIYYEGRTESGYLNDRKISDIYFPELLFIDSGGYECLEDALAEELDQPGYKPKAWDISKFGEVLDNWNFEIPTSIISYDHPRERNSLKDQVVNAVNFFEKYPGTIKEFLVKPETLESPYIDVEGVIENIHLLSGFDIIGFTDKELGHSLLDKLVSISKIRLAMNESNIEIPIHIFGCLDTITTPLFFMCGSDIFDGLSWLRFLYLNGQTVYLNSGAPIQFGLTQRDENFLNKCWLHNSIELDILRGEMNGYLEDYSFKNFKYNASFFEEAINQVRNIIKE